MTIRPSPPRLLRDKILMLLSDGCYHSLYEISKLDNVAPGAWYQSLSELTEHGYMFGRRNNSILLLAERSTNERARQDLAVLLAGADATKPEPGGGRPPRASLPPDAEDRETVRSYEPASKHVPHTPSVSEIFSLQIGDVDMQLSAKEYVTSTRAILARKSSGKTYLGTVIAEELLRITKLTGTPMPFVIIDPTGVWYGLCATAEGLESMHQVLRLGGTHGEFPLRWEGGADAARAVVELWPLSVILDVSDMLPEEQHQFFGDFGNQLYTTNKKPIHLFIDEADDFCPQSVESGNKAQRRALGVGDRIVRRARVKGIGVTLITQRPAVISKNVLSQVDGIFFLSVTAPHDLEAVDSWMRPAVTNSDRQLALEALPTLEMGEAFFVQSHKKSGALIKFRTRKKLTFDSSKTPSVDEPEPPVPKLSKVPYDVWYRVSKFFGNKESEEETEGDLPELEVGDDGREED